MMSLSTRFSNTVKAIDDLIKQGTFGDIYYAHASSIRRVGIPGANKNALHFIQKGGGAFRDMGVHVLDAAWALMGFPKPVSVFGVAGAKFGPRGQGYWFVDEATATRILQPVRLRRLRRRLYPLRKRRGVAGREPLGQPHGTEFAGRLFGTEAGAQMRPPVLYQTIDGELTDTPIEVPETPIAWNNIGKHFLDCILDGVPCKAPLRHGLIVQHMMEGLLESAETGEVVYL